MLDFHLLGPLQVHRGGEPIEVTSPKQRALLIRLLLDAGDIVSRDVLVDDLWRGRPPAQALVTLRSYISHLRRALDEPGDDGSVIVTEGVGYGIEVAPDALDTVRFERLALAGRERLHAGAAAEAVDRLDEALALWRGRPLSDVAYEDYARAAIARLEELRWTVREDRADAALELGRHLEAVPWLEELVAEQPLRERPHTQLMLALYRSGRAPEALAVHQRLRTALLDELGLDPSPALDRLRDRILQQPPELDPPGGVGPPVDVRVAADTAPVAADPTGTGGEPGDQAEHARSPQRPPLPRLLTKVIGRRAERQQVREFLERSRLVSLLGPGGAGKTTLALAVAHEIADRYPEPPYYAALSAETDPARVPVAVASALGLTVEPSSAERQVIAHLATRPALLILDNCEHLADACANLVEQLLRSTDRLTVLTTTREVLGVPGEVQLSVPPLPADDALRLFVARAATVRPDLVIDDHLAAIERICARLDGMPLAIELAAARVRTLEPAEIALRLDDRFRLLTAGGRTAEARHRTLRAVVDWSHELLTDEERTLLRRLAIFQGGWTLEAAEDICADDAVPDVLDVLQRLVDRSLVVVDGGRFSMLETVRLYAEERLVAADEIAAVAARHAAYFTGLAESTEGDLRGGDQAAALARLRAEEPNLRSALRWGRDHASERPDLGLQLAASLGWYWYVGRQVDGRAELGPLLAAATDASPSARARGLLALSLAHRPAGCLVHPSRAAADAAEESAALFTASGEPTLAALSQLLVAVEGVEAVDLDEDVRRVDTARDALRAADDAWGLALADFVEMELRLTHADHDEALALGRRAARQFDVLDDHWGRSAVRLHLGMGLRSAGVLDEAAAVLEVAADLSRRTGLRNNLARALVERAEVELHRGEVAATVAWLDRAETVTTELADETLDGLVAVGRAAVARLRSEHQLAAERYEEALAAFTRGQVDRGVARAAVGAAAVALDGGDLERAVTFLERASRIVRDGVDAALAAAVDEQRARLASRSGDAAGADRLLARADQRRRSARRPRAVLDALDLPGAPLVRGTT